MRTLYSRERAHAIRKNGNSLVHDARMHRNSTPYNRAPYMIRVRDNSKQANFRSFPDSLRLLLAKIHPVLFGKDGGCYQCALDSTYNYSDLFWDARL